MALPLILSITANIFVTVAMGQGSEFMKTPLASQQKGGALHFACSKCRQGSDTIVALEGGSERGREERTEHLKSKHAKEKT